MRACVNLGLPPDTRARPVVVGEDQEGGEGYGAGDMCLNWCGVAAAVSPEEYGGSYISYYAPQRGEGE